MDDRMNLFVRKRRIMQMETWCMRAILAETFLIALWPGGATAALLLGILFWLGRWRLDPEFHFRQLPFDVPVALFVILGGASVLASPDWGFSFYNYYNLVGVYALTYLLIGQNVRKRSEVKHIALALGAGAMLVVFYGFYQYLFGIDTTDMKWVDGSVFPSLHGRVFSTLENPNILAGYLDAAICIVLGVYSKTRGRPRRMVLGVAMVLMALCLSMTYARGCFLTLGLIFAWYGIWRDRRVLVACLVVAVLLVLWDPALYDRVASVFTKMDTSSEMRLAIWESTVAMIEDHPFFGIGWGAFWMVYPSYDFYLQGADVKLVHAHNMYLNYAAEIGIVGALSFFWFFFGTMRVALGYRDEVLEEQRAAEKAAEEARRLEKIRREEERRREQERLAEEERRLEEERRIREMKAAEEAKKAAEEKAKAEEAAKAAEDAAKAAEAAEKAEEAAKEAAEAETSEETEAIEEAEVKSAEEKEPEEVEAEIASEANEPEKEAVEETETDEGETEKTEDIEQADEEKTENAPDEADDLQKTETTAEENDDDEENITHDEENTPQHEEPAASEEVSERDDTEAVEEPDTAEEQPSPEESDDAVTEEAEPEEAETETAEAEEEANAPKEESEETVEQTETDEGKESEATEEQEEQEEQEESESTEEADERETQEKEKEESERGEEKEEKPEETAKSDEAEDAETTAKPGETSETEENEEDEETGKEADATESASEKTGEPMETEVADEAEKPEEADEPEETETVEASKQDEEPGESETTEESEETVESEKAETGETKQPKDAGEPDEAADTGKTEDAKDGEDPPKKASSKSALAAFFSSAEASARQDEEPEVTDDGSKEPEGFWGEATTWEPRTLCEGMGLGIGFAMVSVALNGLTDDLLFNIPSSMLLWLLAALAASLPELPREEEG